MTNRFPAERPPLALPAALALEAPPGFESALASLGVSLDAAAITKLGAFLAYLLAMNEQMNLTAIKDPVAAWERHALDALSLVPHLSDLDAGERVLDVGSGGGVPGIPLAVARPDLELVLLDATLKKVDFLRSVAAALGLSNVQATAGRAEALAAGDMRGSFAAVTARAVAKIAALLPWTAPFVRPGGRLLFIKGERAEEELADARNAMKKLRCTLDRIVPTPTGRVVVLRAG